MGKMLDRKESSTAIPPLVEGDRLKLDEFLRRYEADKTAVRAELLNGVVYVNARRIVVNGKETIVPPISLEGHGRPQIRIATWLGVYDEHTPGVAASAPFTVRMAEDKAPEPDVSLSILPDYRSRPTSGEHRVPELIVEIANTSASTDLGIKFDMYQSAGVQEYLVWRTERRLLNWFLLVKQHYVPLEPDVEGIIRSVTFPGLWLDTKAVQNWETSSFLTTLQLGLASPEHAAFVAKLQAKAKRKKK